tara:strand:- start:6328 stop:6720 length:393 start_codon:yes stop_codon:yes gene_type:complete
MAYDASLPFRRDETTGFATIDTVADAVHQDLRILLLTTPGERVMDPLFGVGLKRFLFQPLVLGTLGDIEVRIRNQVKKYLNFITIVNIDFSSALSTAPGTSVTDMDENLLGITISYQYGYNEVRDLYITA